MKEPAVIRRRSKCSSSAFSGHTILQMRQKAQEAVGNSSRGSFCLAPNVGMLGLRSLSVIQVRDSKGQPSDDAAKSGPHCC
jgi:hypothetical protein